MRHSQEGIARTESLLNAAGFNIDFYETCEQLNLVEWWACLWHRSYLRGEIGVPHKSDPTDIQDLHFRVELNSPQINDAQEKLTLLARRHTTVGFDTEFDRIPQLMWIFHEIFSDPCKAADVAMAAIKQSEAAHFVRDPISTDDRDHLLKSATVDMRGSPEIVIRHFQRWYEVKRAEMESQGIPLPSASSYTKADFSRWSRYRLLACIDLRLFCDAFKTPLANNRAGAKLFPKNATQADQEKMRRTVVRLADEMMDLDTIYALTAQVECELNTSL